MMKVAIIKKETNELACTYSIHLEGLNYDPSHEEYFEKAWSNAVDDQQVSPRDRESYSFSFVE